MTQRPILIRLKTYLKQFFRSLAKWFFLAVPRRVPALQHEAMGFNLIGYYQGDLGLGEALRYIAQAIELVKIPFIVRQFHSRLFSGQSSTALSSYLSSRCTYPINCIALNPDVIYRLPFWLKLSEWTAQYNIAYWFWELGNFPQEWAYALPLVDEIWVNTEFNANAMAQAHCRVTKIPFAVEFAMPSPSLNRAYFGLPEQGFLFLSTFDFHSLVARKNPQAAIDAFIAAFSQIPNDAYLILKSINGHLHPQAFENLLSATKKYPRIVLTDRQLSSTEMHGLLQCADCYVSLHRSEGLGLGMAESMYLGKPVIATAYSGNLEFMNEHNACLVSYDLVPVDPDDYVFSHNQVWAEIHLEAAILAMQKIYQDVNYRTDLGINARTYMLHSHSFAVMGAAIAKRLSQIQALPK